MPTEAAISAKRGNEVPTFSVSRMVIGLRDRRAATAKAMAMRWSPWDSTVPPVNGAGSDPRALDPHAVGRRGDRHADRLEAFGHHRDPVRLLDPQFLGAAQHGGSVGAGSGDEQHREFVDRQRHQFRRDLDAAQVRAAYPQVGDRFAADDPRRWIR